jgi:hypothetical protein
LSRGEFPPNLMWQEPVNVHVVLASNVIDLSEVQELNTLMLFWIQRKDRKFFRVVEPRRTKNDR